MMSMLFALFPVLTLCLCYTWECGSLEGSQCFASSSSTLHIKVKPCPSSSKCAINEMNTVMPYDFSKPRYDCVALTWLPTKKLPGEICATSTECLSQLCQGGVCRGKAVGLQCTMHDECDVGLICSTMRAVCVPQVGEGSFCSSDDECANDCLCYNGKCALILSLPNGSPFSGWMSPNAIFLCSSGYIAKNQCTAAPKNKNPPDFACLNDYDCGVIFPDQSTGTGHCYCGFNAYGLSYCQAQAGDTEFDPVKAGLLSIRNETTKCHYSLSLSSRCPALAALSQYDSFLNSYYLYYYRHGVIGVEDCVRSLMPFTENYAYSLEIIHGGSEGSDKTVVIVVVVVVFTVILVAGIVCCLCIRKCAIDERNQEITRRRILRDEMEEIPLRVSRVVNSTSNAASDPASPPEPPFQISDIALHPLNRRYLQMGIPVGQQVHPSTFEVQSLAEDYEEVIGVPQLLPGISRESHLETSPALLNKSRPGSHETSAPS